VSFRYWEGTVSARGRGERGLPVEGRGYVELTGYAGETPDR
jgi:predicted secreted hydrolase